MIQKSQNDSSLAEELPYWDFFDFPKAHLILNDGSLVAGLSVQLIDIECLDDGEINQFTMGLRSVLNSISEGVTVQFHLSVDSDYSEMIEKHICGKKELIHPLVKSIADFREAKLKASLVSEVLYKPTLSALVSTPWMKNSQLGF